MIFLKFLEILLEIKPYRTYCNQLTNLMLKMRLTGRLLLVLLLISQRSWIKMADSRCLHKKSAKTWICSLKLEKAAWLPVVT